MNKILSEPYYKDLYKHTNIDFCKSAGYFDMTSENSPDYDIDLNCTPTSFIKNVDTSKKNCILISTGAHCPMHDGHIAMMNAAKEEVENQNYNVLTCILSPGHDEYVKSKTDDGWIPAHLRVTYASELCKEYEHISIDPWEAIFAPGSVNFTSVVYRYELLLKKYNLENVEIFYVCGRDNYKFYHAFNYTNKVNTIVVGRSGYKHVTANYTYVDLDVDVSSTQIRNDGFKINHKLPKTCVIRTDGSDIEKDIIKCISKRFDNTEIQYINKNNDLFAHSPYNVVNLDSISNFGMPLSISRNYDKFGHKKLGFVQRPECDSLETELENIALNNDEVYLFDDDIATGSTIKFVINLLNDYDVNVIDVFSYTSSNNRDIEILDARDFIFDRVNCGLVIDNGLKQSRLPYIYPFVDPFVRASIIDPLIFSIEIWEIMVKYDIIKNINYLEFLNIIKNNYYYEYENK